MSVEAPLSHQRLRDANPACPHRARKEAEDREEAEREAMVR